jgi:ABC-2 type transport system permease protein
MNSVTPSTTGSSSGSTSRAASAPERDLQAPAWVIVARREILAKLMEKSFIFSTVITVAIIGAFMGISSYLDAKATTYTLVTTSAAAHDTAARLGPKISAIDDKVRVTTREVADEAAATSLVRDEDDTVWFHEGPNGWTVTARDEVPSALVASAEAAIRTDTLERNAAAAGTTVSQLTQGSALGVDILNGDAERQGFAKAVAFVLAFLFYMASLGFGMMLAGSVVEEKASRIVEIITTRIPVRQLLAGKVLGNVVLALGQMGLYLGIGLIGLTFTPYKSYLSSVSQGIGWFLAFFLVGFLLLACLWAVAGSLASRSEDLQQTAMPLSMMLMLVWFSLFLAKGMVATVLSFVPLFSAVLMPMRILQGGVPVWQPLVALALSILAAGAVVLVAERLYRRALLQTQGRLSIRQAWAAAE